MPSSEAELDLDNRSAKRYQPRPMSVLRRHDRLNREILRELSRLAQRELRDPRVGQVTFTRVELTEDLREAKVWFVPLAGLDASERIAELQGGLDAARKFLQRRVGQNLKLRFTPKMSFRYDKGLSNLVRIHDLMDGLKPEDGEALDETHREDENAVKPTGDC
ncbi:MAG: 30S ribosome-binding factor RbfA [Myxococcota bacterium]|nr:30S ribosome-binding factor RbfA [Myxococcota bacterium]